MAGIVRKPGARRNRELRAIPAIQSRGSIRQMNAPVVARVDAGCDHDAIGAGGF
jgi:hypothetical protein